MLHRRLPLFLFACCGVGIAPAISLAAPASTPPSARATVAFELPAQTGILEGIAFRAATGDFFFGDVHHRCVWRRDPSGTLTRFSPAGDVLYGVFGLTVDERRHLLWAATSMVPETAGFTSADEGRAALVALDLTTGRVARICSLPADAKNHVLGDLLLAPDGTVYVTDSIAPLVWSLSPGANNLAPFVESASFRSLQGLALVAGGKKLLVSDYSHGLFTIDLATRQLRQLTAPSGADLRGLDGLLADGDSILAVYNAASPNHLLRLVLSSDATAVARVEPLAAGLSGFDDLTLITLVGGHPQVIANSGWALVDPKKSPAVSPHAVRVFSFR